MDTLGDWGGDATVCASVLDVVAKVGEREGLRGLFRGEISFKSRENDWPKV